MNAHEKEMFMLGAQWKLLRSLKDASFCATGKLTVTRSEIEWIINTLDGTIHSAVRSNTGYLLVPDGEQFRRGSKYKAANAQSGTMIISESVFCKLILPTVEELLAPQ